MPDVPRRIADGDEQLGEVRHAVARDLADDVGGDRHVTPAEDREGLLGGDPLDRLDRRGALRLVHRQEGETDGIRAGAGQR